MAKNKPGNAKKAPELTAEVVRELRAQGLTNREIGARYGVSHSVPNQRLRDAGFKSNVGARREPKAADPATLYRPAVDEPDPNDPRFWS